MNFAASQPAKSCTGRVEPGSRHLLAWCREAYPTGSSMGIYNCRSVVGGSATSLHSEGRALDYGMPLSGGRGSALGHELVRRLGKHGRRLGIQLIIYDRRYWSARHPGGTAYGGRHPHYDHLHIELTWAAARNITLATFRDVLGGTKEDDVLKRGDSGAQVGFWQRRLNDVRNDVKGPFPRLATDGQYGAATEAAVKAVQANVAWPQTGVLDLSTAVYLSHLALAVVGGGQGGGGLDQDAADARYVRKGPQTLHLE